MQHIDKFDISQVPVNRILFAVTSEPDYEMQRVYIVEDYPTWGETTVIDGGHCSCYGFDETTWGAITYTGDEMKKLMQGWLSSGSDIERIAARAWFETKR